MLARSAFYRLPFTVYLYSLYIYRILRFTVTRCHRGQRLYEGSKVPSKVQLRGYYVRSRYRGQQQQQRRQRQRAEAANVCM